jgi:hypothetical protein
VARDKTHPNEAREQRDDAKHGYWSQHELKQMNDEFARAIAREEREQSEQVPAKRVGGYRENLKRQRGGHRKGLTLASSSFCQPAASAGSQDERKKICMTPTRPSLVPEPTNR